MLSTAAQVINCHVLLHRLYTAVYSKFDKLSTIVQVLKFAHLDRLSRALHSCVLLQRMYTAVQAVHSGTRCALQFELGEIGQWTDRVLL
jgi:hypothetical protein